MVYCNYKKGGICVKRKYPTKVFWMGFIGNFMIRSFYLFLPGLVLCIVGIWVKVCLWIGLGLLGLDAVINLVDQLQLRKTALSNTEFNELMEALTGPGGLDAFGKVLEEKIHSTPPVEISNEEN